MAGRPRSITPLERFTEKYVILPNGCWEWTSGLTRGNYASFSFQGGSVRAARWSYETFVETIPSGFDVDHACHSRSTDCPGGDACRHRRCVNPVHIQAVDKGEHGRRTRLKVCRAGLHDLTDPENRNPSVRGCYACKKLAIKDRYRRDPEPKRARQRQRYQDDAEYRARVIAAQVARDRARRGGQ